MLKVSPLVILRLDMIYPWLLSRPPGVPVIVDLEENI